MHDVIIVGAGPAGLSAALILGRCRRRVLVIDSGHPRNASAEHVHGFLTRDGVEPSEMQRLARGQIVRYGVEFRTAEAVEGECSAEGFEIACDDGSRFRSRKLLLATGMADVLPDIPGLRELYGRSVHHCPYCDGWEHRDQHLAAYGRGEAGAGVALALRVWSEHVTACTDGETLSEEWSAKLAARGIPIRTERVVRLRSESGRLTALEFDEGEPLACEGLFFNTSQVQRTPLASLMGCRMREDGAVETGDHQRTSVPGLWLAGDADKEVQFAIVAAAEGATAAVSMTRELQDEELREAAGGRAR